MPRQTTDDRAFALTWPDLDAVFDELWRHLEDAGSRAASQWHLPVLSTIGPEGPESRMVVLREANREQRRLLCHTDLRSGKIEQIEADPRLAWLLYDHNHRVQLSIHGIGNVHTSDDLADERWTASTPESRRCYLAPHEPGRLSEEITVNLPEELRHRKPTEEETQLGRSHFAVISCQVHSIDFLSLHHDGNHRARFTWENEAWRKSYVEP